jgi:metal-responsive CopG/Arc/MetJ family transcriptional regulator
VTIKPKEPRVTIAVRVSAAGLTAIDERAEEEDRTRSEIIRRMLAYAVQKMPRGWKP